MLVGNLKAFCRSVHYLQIDRCRVITVFGGGHAEVEFMST